MPEVAPAALLRSEWMLGHLLISMGYVGPSGPDLRFPHVKRIDP